MSHNLGRAGLGYSEAAQSIHFAQENAVKPSPEAIAVRTRGARTALWWARLFTALTFIALLMYASQGHAQGAVPGAGKVVFVSGPAELVAADGSRRAVAAGTEIRQGEQIATGLDGYVHLRMVDNAFVAVRPDSRLAIEVYEYDAARPAASKIKLQLFAGNARTVSGKGGEAAKQNYRFNTPMAAIGLRGTDYTVVSGADATRVSVSRGAVAVTPLGDGCSAAALGPCATSATRELNAGLSHAYLEVSPRNRVPVLVRPEQDPQGGANQNPANRPQEPNAENKSELKLASSKEAVNQVAADKITAGLPATAPTTTPAPARVNELVWGRWSQGVGELFTADRDVYVGNEMFALFGPKIGNITLPSQGVFSFGLAGSEAYAVNNGVVSPAQVKGGSFSVDFNQRTFNTALSVAYSGGLEQMNAQGSVQHQGFMFSDPARSNMNVSGVVGNGGNEAAYLFDKALASGGLLGAVRWVR